MSSNYQSLRSRDVPANLPADRRQTLASQSGRRRQNPASQSTLSTNSGQTSAPQSSLSALSNATQSATGPSPMANLPQLPGGPRVVPNYYEIRNNEITAGTLAYAPSGMGTRFSLYRAKKLIEAGRKGDPGTWSSNWELVDQLDANALPHWFLHRYELHQFPNLAASNSQSTVLAVPASTSSSAPAASATASAGLSQPFRELVRARRWEDFCHQGFRALDLVYISGHAMRNGKMRRLFKVYRASQNIDASSKPAHPAGEGKNVWEFRGKLFSDDLPDDLKRQL